MRFMQPEVSWDAPCHFLLFLFFVIQIQAGRPNVVIVFIEYMRWEDFSCYRYRKAETPNVDHLAMVGIRFERFYENSPICSPYRMLLPVRVSGKFSVRTTDQMARSRTWQKNPARQWTSPANTPLRKTIKRSSDWLGHVHATEQWALTSQPEQT